MKKLISVILCIVLLLSLCSCGKEATATDEGGYGTVTVEPVEPVDTPETEPEPTPEPTPEPLSAVSYTGDFSGYRRIMPTAANASSALNFMGKIFFPEYAADGDISTCWQEGSEGAGANESIMISFGRTISADLLRLRLGHAKDDNSYYMNARPASLLIEFSGGESMVYDFPDTNEWHTIELSAAVKCEWVKLTIKSVYGGDEYEDNCIAEIAVYSESPGEGAETGYYGGLVPPEQEVEFVAVLHEDSYTYPDAYSAYLDLLATNRWAWDFGINLLGSSRLYGGSLEDFWGVTLVEYLEEYPLAYMMLDMDNNGVDELIITGDFIIGIIEDCYIFTFRDGKIVYLGSVAFVPGSIFNAGEQFIFFNSVTNYGCELNVSLDKGVIKVGEIRGYNLDEGKTPDERGLKRVADAYERNRFTEEPYLDPIIARIP